MAGVITSRARRTRVPAAVLTALLAAAALAGCVSEEDAPPVAKNSGAVFEGPAGPTPSEDTDVDVEAESGQPPGVLQEIRTAALDQVDRVVLVFGGLFDGYTVGYVNSVAATFGGETRTIEPADLGGTAMLRIKVRNATTGTVTGAEAGDDGADGAAATGASSGPYTGPTSTSAGLSEITGYTIVADDGSDLTVAVGVTQRRPFIVLELAGPARLNVEIAHPAP